MSFKPYYISNFDENSGENDYFESFLIPEKAFNKLQDAVCWRAKVIKRPGNELLARLRRILTSQTLSVPFPALPVTNISIADFFSDAAIDLRNPATGIKEPYAEIEPGSVSINVGGNIFVDTGLDGVLICLTGSGTINYITGQIDLKIPAGVMAATPIVVTLAYFPSLPVMGLNRREAAAINNEQTIAFDTKYCYTLITDKYQELTTPSVVWEANDYNLFWTLNYYLSANGRIYWATNGKYSIDAAFALTNPIRYYNGATWTDFAPIVNNSGVAIYMFQCKILIAFKGFLIAMNVTEGVDTTHITNYVNKIRWSQQGEPRVAVIPGDGGDVDAWRDDIVGKGGFLVAPTNEAIVSAGFIRDVLLVKFEHSSWKLVFTGNTALPFVFQKVNSDLGCESPFSLVQFDKGVLAVGDKGVTVDDSVNVSRIDVKVPEAVFKIKNSDNAPERVYGIRDFASELAYFSYPIAAEPGTETIFPNNVLVYNYINDTWAKFNDNYTCYGYFQRSTGKKWKDYHIPWKSCGFTWSYGAQQSLFLNVIAGNQQGFVSIVSSAKSPNDDNGATLSITHIENVLVATQSRVELTIPNHNLQTGSFIKIRGIIGTATTGVNPNVLNYTSALRNVYKVLRIDKDKIYILKWVIPPPTSALPEGLYYESLSSAVYVADYWGGGTVTIVNNFIIDTKQFSPYYEQASQCRLGYIDLFLDRTESGQFTGDVYVDSNKAISITEPNDSLLGSNVIYSCPENIGLIPYQADQDKIWHRLFVQAICQNFTLSLSMSDKQMMYYDSGSEGFRMQALAFYLSPNARLVQ